MYENTTDTLITPWPTPSFYTCTVAFVFATDIIQAV